MQVHGRRRKGTLEGWAMGRGREDRRATEGARRSAHQSGKDRAQAGARSKPQEKREKKRAGWEAQRPRPRVARIEGRGSSEKHQQWQSTVVAIWGTIRWAAWKEEIVPAEH
ncbi:unnamed protein product [Calypogeia fissa]